MLAAVDELAPGTDFAGLRIAGVAGRGSMATVYRATDGEGRELALKVLAAALTADGEFRYRFEREARAVAAIRHPHIVRVYGGGAHEGRLFVTMRYVVGDDLARRLTAGPLAVAEAAELISQVAAALDAAHALGIVHRDVKPANVLLEGDPPHAYLTDFGLMKDIRSTTPMTIAGTFIGTCDYAAPEQLLGLPVDGRADVYALGCMLYEMVTGEVPFPRDSAAATMFAHVELPPPPVAAAPAFDAVIARAMAKPAADRYPTAGELARAAVAAARGEAV
jgi:serine/threonine protein kinase